MAERPRNPYPWCRRPIPDEYRICTSMDQRHYLCDGSLRSWYGPVQKVASPICVGRTEDVPNKGSRCCEGIGR